MARAATKSRGATGDARKRTRAEQKRARTTRLSILAAALLEFADKGFEGASIRSIAERTKLQHPLITYHYPTKDALWRATAEYAFEQIREKWDKSGPELSGAAPIDRLRAEYRTVFYYTAAFPEFHRFMRQEAMYDNPRLRWVAETILAPLIERLLPQIRAAQRDGDLPAVEPIVFHYMMISLTAMLAGFGPEMRVTGRVRPEAPAIVDSYWSHVENMVFGRRANA
ncbi:MAG: TetR/AcrR family transcriptional regulator [Xanthobacteraceae bacterium]|jgi:AcrR family transcriptional regulator